MNEPATIDPHKLATVLELDKGGHDPRLAASAIMAHNQKMCIMEAIAYVCDLNWTDHPTCVDPFFNAIGIWYNDHCGSKNRRNQLIPLIPKLVNSIHASEEIMQERRLVFFQRLLDVVVAPVLHGVSVTEASWFTQHVLTEPEMDERMKLLKQRKTDSATPDSIKVLYDAFVKGVSIGFYDYGDRVLRQLHGMKTQPKLFWDDLLTVIDDALNVRDLDAEALAEVRELKRLDRLLAKERRAQSVAPQRSTVPVPEPVLA